MAAASYTVRCGTGRLQIIHMSARHTVLQWHMAGMRSEREFMCNGQANMWHGGRRVERREESNGRMAWKERR